MGSGIYIIRNTINKKVYIGSAVCFKRRFYEHRYKLLKNKHCNMHLQNFVNKYRFETLLFEILEVVLDKNKLIEREQFYIDSCKFSALFNICKVVGSPLGRKHSEASKKKMSERQKGSTHTLGHKHSEATKNKISKSNKGKKHTESSKKKISEGLKGRKLSKEHKNNISESLKGKRLKTVLIFKDGILIDKILGCKKVSEKYNLNKTSISKVCIGSQKITGGYTMKYKL